jgi:2-oxoglutarate dehydrogenase E2 component (dihydrolipoamide succinyltransferase)
MSRLPAQRPEPMTSIKVPPLGESIVEATVSRWMKKEGDVVSPGDTLVELETDKITVEVPAMSRGVLTKRLHSEGDVVKVDDLLGEIDESAAPALTKRESTMPTPPMPVQAVPSAPATAPAPQKSAQPARAELRTSPAAERLATQQKVDLTAVPGTGRGGVVSKADVIDFLGDGQAQSGPVRAPAPAEGPTAPINPRPPGAAPPAVPPRPAIPASTRETRETLSTRRRRIAEHLLESQHATAHLTTFNEIDMSAVEALRARIKERIEKEHGVRLSAMPFFVKAACFALKTYPIVNAQLDGDSIVYKHYVNMGIAVASEAGLVVPSIKDADQKGLLQISREIGDVAKKARDGKLTMEDLTGGTFTITNGGVFGSLISTPILNYPQVGILGLHKVQERPIAVAGKVEIRPMMYVALSYDHRIIDGQQAVLFLVRLKELMEDPATMLVV